MGGWGRREDTGDSLLRNIVVVAITATLIIVGRRREAGKLKVEEEVAGVSTRESVGG